MCESLLPSSHLLVALFLLVLASGGHGSCPADQAASISAGAVPQELLWEAQIQTGEIVPLAQADTAWTELISGQSQEYECWALHWGFTGSFKRVCGRDGTTATAGKLATVPHADISGCLRTGCAWHRHILQPAIGPYLVTEGPEISHSGTNSAGLWGCMVLASNGAFYAAPMGAAGVLRIDTERNVAQVLFGPDLGHSGMKYSAIVQALDGIIYAIPYSAPRVLRIDPANDGISAIGEVFDSDYKWSHGVLASDRCIYGIPSFASAVLRLDPVTGDTSMLPVFDGSGVLKWLHGVVAPNGIIFGIPGNSPSVLRIDPVASLVSSFGDFGAQARKWAHGLVGIDGQIYGVPSSATSVLRIDPVGSTASATLGQGLPDSDFKWSMGVAAADGNIYCIPRASQQVLRIDPRAGTIDLFGSTSSNTWKWEYGVLALDGLIYAAPSSASRVLRINPISSIAEEIGPDLGRAPQKYDAAALAPSGRIFAAPSSVVQVLQIGAEVDVCTRAPLGLDVTCTLGIVCQVVLTSFPGGQSAVGPANVLWISTAQGSCADRATLSIKGLENPQGNSSSLGSGGRQFTMGIGIEGAPSFTHRLCWSPTNTSREVITLGLFTLHGPEQKHTRCTYGLPCTIRIAGYGLSLGSSLSVINSSSPCGSMAPAPIGGFTNPKYLNVSDTLSDSNALHDLGVSQSGPPGVYSLCWCQTPSQSPTDAAGAGCDFLVYIGELTLIGPLLHATLIECWVGTPCAVSVEGTDLSTTNQLSVREDCNEQLIGDISGLVSEATPSSDGRIFSLGTPREGGRRLLALCWHSTASSPGVHYSNFQVYGTLDGGIAVLCTLSRPCNFTIQDDFFYGTMDFLSMQNRLLVVSGAGTACPEQGKALWNGTSNPSAPVDNSSFYSLGTPNAATYEASQAIITDYTLCLSVDGQPDSFSMYIGSLKVNDTRCTVPDVIFGASPPCISLERTQEQVAVLGHAESCAPLCQQYYSPAQEVLTCLYGQLEPPLFECRKKCMRAPSVTYGEDHSHCTDLVHGTRCELQCPAGSVKSGDLECIHGHWVHRPTLPHELLFDVPRCYRNCNAQAAGCAAAGNGQLQHGDVCRAVCPPGLSPSISEVRCNDGSAQPASFVCYENCALPPAIPHSTGMEVCADASPGARCYLLCEPGYVRSGDPVCEGGAWTVEHCYAPCRGPSVVNSGPMPCNGLDLVEHGSHCSPSCLDTFTPVVQVGSDLVISGSSGPNLECTDGVLTPPSFSCLASCMKTPEVEYSDTDVLHTCRGTPHGSICPTPCLPGYRKFGDLKCINGSFTPSSCRKECDEPPDIEFAEMNHACWQSAHGEVCTTFCHDGWLPSGSAVCENGIWSSVQCLRTCSAPSGVRHSLWPSCVEGDTIASSGFCTPRCVEGFIPSETKLECVQGKLHAQVFMCQRFCGVPASIANAVDILECETVEVGQTCDLECVAGFRPSGRLRCDMDGWHQHRGSTLADGLPLRHGYLLGLIDTGREFVLSFEINLMSPAGQNYENVLHFTATGSNCCEVGDRVPAVFLAPALNGASGRDLHVFLDPGTGCSLNKPLPIGTRTQVVISFVGKVLQVSLDGIPFCTNTYSSDLEPQTDVAVYVSSPWYDPADAEVWQVAYEHVGFDDALPICEPVTCQDLLPPVPGALEDETSVSSACIGAAFNTTCERVSCPQGTVLSGRFVCGAEGKWISEDGATVSCKTVLCSETLPFVSQRATNSICLDRKYGDICTVTCEKGYGSSGAFSCRADGIWAELDGSAARCYALNCLTTPLIAHGAGQQICNQLPSGMVCEAECFDGWMAVGGFRCDAQLWVDAPVCAEDASLIDTSDVPNRPIVKAGFSAEPSSDIQNTLLLPEQWGEAVARAFSLGMEEYLTAQLTEPATVQVLASVGFELTAGGRRAQETSTRPNPWRADLVFVIIPKGSTSADAQAVYASLVALSTQQLAFLVREAMSPVRPETMDVRLSTPRLAEMSAGLLDALPSLLTEEPTTTTNEQYSTTSSPIFLKPSSDNVSSGSSPSPSGAPLSSGGDREDSSSASWYLGEEEEAVDTGAFAKWLLFVFLPLGLCAACLIFWRFLKYNGRRNTDSDAIERSDFDMSIETWCNEHVSDGVNLQAKRKFDQVSAQRDRMDFLKEALQQQSASNLVHATEEDRKVALSFWDLDRAPTGTSMRRDPKANRTTRQMTDHQMHLAIKMHEQGLRKQRWYNRGIRFVKQHLYVLVCARQVARKVERRKAKREGRESRFANKADQNSSSYGISRFVPKSPRRPSQEMVQESLATAGLPQFIIEKVKQRVGDAQQNDEETVEPAEPSEHSVVNEADLLPEIEDLEPHNSVFTESGTMEQQALAGSARDAGHMSPKPTNNERSESSEQGSVSQQGSLSPKSPSKASDKYAPPIAEEHEQGEEHKMALSASSELPPHEGMGAGLMQQAMLASHLKHMTQEQYDAYRDHLVDSFFEGDYVDEVAKDFAPVLMYWDPKTQAMLKAKGKKTTTADTPDDKKAGTLERFQKNSNIAHDVVIETHTTKYSPPTRKIFDENYKKVMSVRSGQSEVSARDSTRSSRSDKSDEKPAPVIAEAVKDEGHADKLSDGRSSGPSSPSSSSESGQQSGDDVVFGDEDEDAQGDGESGTDSDADEIAEAAHMSQKRMSLIGQKDAQAGGRRHPDHPNEGVQLGSSDLDMKLRPPTNPEVLEAIKAARGTSAYVTAGREGRERSDAAKAYWGIDTREGLNAGWNLANMFGIELDSTSTGQNLKSMLSRANTAMRLGSNKSSSNPPAT